MKKFHKVTILGVFIGSVLFICGCGLGFMKNDKEMQTYERDILTAEEIESKILDGIQYFEEGQLGKAQRIIQEVLADSPDHPRAVYYSKRMQQPLFCTVYPGDTLSEIAEYYYNDKERWKSLARANQIQTPESLKLYQRLRVPLFSSYVEGRDELGRIKDRFFGKALPSKILMYPIKEGDRLQELSKRYYGIGGLYFFLADYNCLGKSEMLKPGRSLKIPIFPKKIKKDTTAQEKKNLDKGTAALKKKNYKEAYKYFSKIPKGSPHRQRARKLLSRCRTEGSAYYENLGDKAFQASKPKNACKYWKISLTLDPKRKNINKKIAEAKDLVSALESLSAIP